MDRIVIQPKMKNTSRKYRIIDLQSYNDVEAKLRQQVRRASKLVG